MTIENTQALFICSLCIHIYNLPTIRALFDIGLKEKAAVSTTRGEEAASPVDAEEPEQTPAGTTCSIFGLHKQVGGRLNRGARFIFFFPL